MSNTDESNVLSVGIIDLTRAAESIKLLGSRSGRVQYPMPSRATECDFCFILGAPSDCSLQSNSYLTVFLDPHDLKRHLPAQRYQIRCDRPCGTSDFVLWADQLVTILLTPFVRQDMVCVDPADMRVILHSASNRSVTARAFKFYSLNERTIRILEQQRFQSAYAVLSARPENLSMELYSLVGAALEQNLQDDAVTVLATRNQLTPGYSLLLLHDC